ncbi:CBS domain-containing protein [Catellatospora coxensis]|uniref:Histidine kinase n=2 Tax=Catellatospora TaxID=53365 RepID=A0A8J3KSN8_9ACTN|nr:histidine kinase [Catellatospora coxensis]
MANAAQAQHAMHVREAMSKPVLMVGPQHTLRQAAQLMAMRRVGSAIVIDPDGEGLGIMTERDVLNAIGSGLDPDVEQCANHITWDVVYAAPHWSLEEAAMAMARGGFRHLVVLDGDEVLGIISVRDLMRVWALRRAEAAASV